jgi:hypothetical protein
VNEPARKVEQIGRVQPHRAPLHRRVRRCDERASPVACSSSAPPLVGTRSEIVNSRRLDALLENNIRIQIVETKARSYVDRAFDNLRNRITIAQNEVTRRPARAAEISGVD